MQQSRLAATAVRSYRVLSLARNQAPLRGFAAEPTGRPADPDAYSSKGAWTVQPAVSPGKPKETKNLVERNTAERQTEIELAEAEHGPTKGNKPPYPSFPRLESIGAYNPAVPYIQQKGKNSTLTLKQVNCAGLDGTPWPNDEQMEQEDDLIEYYKHHKASPLSQTNVVDTRKPITRAIDDTADADEDEYAVDVIGWRPEQLDTAEEALERARRIWRENAMRGDPDSPHGRVLRMLRGEWF